MDLSSILLVVSIGVFFSFQFFVLYLKSKGPSKNYNEDCLNDEAYYKKKIKLLEKQIENLEREKKLYYDLYYNSPDKDMTVATFLFIFVLALLLSLSKYWNRHISQSKL